ncbi:unnamed protein product [Rangifer tarandus platyrhynchus]|uniref:Uncharacterized protein n=2 Tax=Rangifer tarandus platyrhynchus TaxID=3082113 RepID=A0ABN8ZP46_RANTA|nr:unnamed protein product [Rangifer tarandus platyrhynchus]
MDKGKSVSGKSELDFSASTKSSCDKILFVSARRGKKKVPEDIIINITIIIASCLNIDSRGNLCWVYASTIHPDSHNGTLGHVQPLLVSREELHSSTSQDE